MAPKAGLRVVKSRHLSKTQLQLTGGLHAGRAREEVRVAAAQRQRAVEGARLAELDATSVASHAAAGTAGVGDCSDAVGLDIVPDVAQRAGIGWTCSAGRLTRRFDRRLGRCRFQRGPRSAAVS